MSLSSAIDKFVTVCYTLNMIIRPRSQLYVNNDLVTDFSLTGNADGFIEINMPYRLQSISPRDRYDIHCVYTDTFCRSFLQCHVCGVCMNTALDHPNGLICFDYRLKYELCIEWELQND